jgi:hypothetical protein
VCGLSNIYIQSKDINLLEESYISFEWHRKKKTMIEFNISTE